jgi:hypothetical protein
VEEHEQRRAARVLHRLRDDDRDRHRVADGTAVDLDGVDLGAALVGADEPVDLPRSA